MSAKVFYNPFVQGYRHSQVAPTLPTHCFCIADLVWGLPHSLIQFLLNNTFINTVQNEVF